MEEQRDITLPAEVTDGRFNLEQVGAISVLMSIPLMNEELTSHWEVNTRFMEIINEFVKSGVAIPVKEDGGIKLEIDLTL